MSLYCLAAEVVVHLQHRECVTFALGHVSGWAEKCRSSHLLALASTQVRGQTNGRCHCKIFHHAQQDIGGSKKGSSCNAYINTSSACK